MKKISYSRYYDKVYGGWIGKCIGGNIGAAVECNKYLMDLQESEIFPEQIPPNDDLDLQILWLQVLETTGIHLTSSDLAEAWQRYCWYPFNEYGYFLHNVERKIDPPVSGWFNNQFFSQSMGCPIRSEIWGMIALGNPELAMKYAYMDGTLDHDAEAVWAEQMLAAMEAQAFFESDMNLLIDFGLDRIPETSQLKRCIQFVRREYGKNGSWQQTRRRMLEKFGSPDASRAVQNLGITVLSLLYGENDFGKTQLIALNCGYDTDCTCATVGAILGIIGGAASIPGDWKRQAKDTFVIGIDVQRPTNRISDLATDTCRVGVAVSRVLNTGVAIEDVPEELGVSRIPVAPPEVAIEIKADYRGNPSVDPETPKWLNLSILNRTRELKFGRLKLEAPSHCLVSPTVAELNLSGLTAQDIAVRIQCNEETVRYASSIVIDATFEEIGGETVKTQIGLAAGQPYYVIGPFWDLYDTSKPGAEPYYNPVSKRIARPQGAENFSNYIDINTPYIEEASFRRLPQGTTWYAAEHKLPINDWIGAAGPACIYVAQDIECPEERAGRLMIGNNDGFKIWVNDIQVAESGDACFWMPYNHDISISLRKGSNRIVAKVIRSGRDSEFSIGYAQPGTWVRWVNDLFAVRIQQSKQGDEESVSQI